MQIWPVCLQGHLVLMPPLYGKASSGAPKTQELCHTSLMTLGPIRTIEQSQLFKKIYSFVFHLFIYLFLIFWLYCMARGMSLVS